MAGNIRYLQLREGRYFTRVVIPPELRPYLGGKTEFRRPLGPDRRTAIRNHHAAVADFQRRIGLAERQHREAGGHRTARLRNPLSPEEMGFRLYERMMELDGAQRHGEFSRQYSNQDSDPDEARDYRDGYAGKLTDDQLECLVGPYIASFRLEGSAKAEKGSTEWRRMAMALCAAMHEFLAHRQELNDGNHSVIVTHPAIAKGQEQAEQPEPIPLQYLFDRYICELAAAGKGRETKRAGQSVIERLTSFLGHDDARAIEKSDLIAFKDSLIKTLSPKTVKHRYFATLGAMFQWAVDNDQLTSNPVKGVKIRVAEKPLNRPKGFTDEEALAILKAALSYQPKRTGNPRTDEAHQTSAAKKWLPWLCALSGARVTEIAQLRKHDVRQEAGVWVMRLTPEAGSIKTGIYRDVPLHDQLVELGFIEFVHKSADDQLFFKAGTTRTGAVVPARTVGDRVSKWLRSSKLVPEGVSPMHGFRHRFKTIGRELGIDARVIDGVQGHAGRTAGDRYGDVTVSAMKLAIDRIPSFSIPATSADENELRGSDALPDGPKFM